MLRVKKIAGVIALAVGLVAGAAESAAAWGGDGCGCHLWGSGASAAWGVAADSPGLLSGNLVQVPVDVPVNACGNSLDVLGALDGAFGDACTTF
jgi:hypothetical protein